VGGGCDGEVDLAPSRVATAPGHGGGKLTPGASELDRSLAVADDDDDADAPGRARQQGGRQPSR